MKAAEIMADAAGLRAGQVEGLALMLALFADAEVSAALEDAATTAVELGSGTSKGHEIAEWLRWRAMADRTRHGAIEGPARTLKSATAADAVARGPRKG